MCRCVFILNELPIRDLQVNVGDAEGFIGRVDFLWREQGVVGEADGLLKYTSAEVLRRRSCGKNALSKRGSSWSGSPGTR